MESLAALAKYKLTVLIQCLACHHEARVKAGDLLEKFGRDLRLREVQDRLKCSRCGRKWCKVNVGAR